MPYSLVLRTRIVFHNSRDSEALIADDRVFSKAWSIEADVMHALSLQGILGDPSWAQRVFTTNPNQVKTFECAEGFVGLLQWLRTRRT